MEIQIITTEKKLTKSLLKQMFQLSYEDFNEAEVLGFITVQLGTADRSALCHYKDDYYLLNMLWEKRGYYAGYNSRSFKGEMIKRFKGDISIDDWFKKYEKIINLAEEKGHIYI